jgi:NADH dehydrogenase
MPPKTLCVLGGTGFVGHHLLMDLANKGYRIKVITRRRERHKALALLPGVTLIEMHPANQQMLIKHLKGCDACINLVGILNGTQELFQQVHVKLPQDIIAACRAVGVGRVLHMSALNANSQGASLYLRSKGEGEKVVSQAENIAATRFCPSVIFGPGDHFLNRFRDLLRITPCLPLACPQARFAPVYVDDVVRAFEIALTDDSTIGKRFELCGPESYSLHDLVIYTAELMGRSKTAVLPLSDRLSRLQAKIFQHLPGQLLTMDNYFSMQVNSVCQHDGLSALGISRHSLEAMAPYFLQGQYARDRYPALRRAARRN